MINNKEERPECDLRADQSWVKASHAGKRRDNVLRETFSPTLPSDVEWRLSCRHVINNTAFYAAMLKSNAREHQDLKRSQPLLCRHILCINDPVDTVLITISSGSEWYFILLFAVTLMFSTYDVFSSISSLWRWRQTVDRRRRILQTRRKFTTCLYLDINSRRYKPPTFRYLHYNKDIRYIITKSSAITVGPRDAVY